MKAKNDKYDLDFKKRILKALKEKRISIKEAKEIINNGIPPAFWIEDEGKLPIRREAYCEVFGANIPTIKFVD